MDGERDDNWRKKKRDNLFPKADHSRLIGVIITSLSLVLAMKKSTEIYYYRIKWSHMKLLKTFL
jgi:hypothetical protein